MADNNNGTKILNVILSIVSTAAIALSAWALTSVVSLREKAVKFEENIGDVDFGALTQQIEQIASDNALDMEQNRRLDALRATDTKFWRITNTHKDWMNEHRDDGEPRVIWPDFGDLP